MPLSVTKSAIPQAEAKQKAKGLQSIAKAQEAVDAAQAELDEIDELIQLTTDLKDFEAQIKRRDELKAKYNKLAAERFQPDEPAIFNGTIGHADFSACSKQTVITDQNGLLGKLKDVIGYEGLLQMIKLTLTDCKKYLSESELSKFTSQTTGSRTFKGVTITDPDVGK